MAEIPDEAEIWQSFGNMSLIMKIFLIEYMKLPAGTAKSGKRPKMKTTEKAISRMAALIEYNDKRDILLLQKRLGHKNLRSTVNYLQRSRYLLQLLKQGS